MGIGIVTLTKEYQGLDWTNVHGFWTNSSSVQGPLTTGDLTQIGIGQAFNPTTTGPAANQGSLANSYFLHALVAFERLVHDDDIVIKRIYVSDGLNPGPGGPSVFAAVEVNIPCLATIGTAASLGPGPVVLQINKNPAQLSVRLGRGFFRGAVADGEIAFGGERLITWRSTTTEVAVKNRVTNAASSSSLNRYFGITNSAEVGYAIPNYQSRCEPVPGALKRVSPVASLAAVRPAVRSVTRRKRGEPPACPPSSP